MAQACMVTRRHRQASSSVDSVIEATYAGFMNLQVPPELEAKLTRLATKTRRSVDQVALDLLASSIDHDEWFRAEVEQGRASAREGRLIEHDDVAARMDMPLKMYSDVILTRDITEHGLRAGDVGTVVARHAVPGVAEEGFSVEFFDMTGNTVAVTTLPASALRLPTPADRLAPPDW
jgi:predicted transcriptional regulator